MIDIDGGNNLLYLPLDKILEPRMSNNNRASNFVNDSDKNSLADKIRNNRDSFNNRKRNLYNE